MLGSRFPDPNASLGQQQTKILIYDLKTKKVANILNLPPVLGTSLKENESKLISIKAESPSNSYTVLPGMHNFVFSPDGKDLWYYSGLTGVTRMDPDNGNVKERLTDFNGSVRALSFNEDGTLLVSATNEISIVNPQPPSKIIKKIGNLGVTQFLYSKTTPGMQYVLAPAVWEGQIVVIDLNQEKVIKRIVTGIDPVQVEISPDKEKAYVTHGRSNWLSEIALNTLTEIRKIKTKGGPNGIGFSMLLPNPVTEIIKLGACLPFTGENAVEGRECRLGLQHWQDTVNNSGGMVVNDRKYNIDIVYADTLSKIDSETLTQTTKDLLSSNKDITVMLGSYPSLANLPIARVAHSASIPFITSTGREKALFDADLDNVFGLSPTRSSDLSGTIKAIWKQVSPKPQSALILSCNKHDSLEEARATAAYAQLKKIELIKPGSSNFWTVEEPGIVVYKHEKHALENIINGIKDYSPDLLLASSHRTESVDIIKACAKYDFVPGALAFNSGISIPFFRNQLGSLANNILGSVTWSDTWSNYAHDRFVTASDFQRSFYGNYSENASELAAGFAASGVIIEEMFRKANSFDGEELKKALKKLELITFYGPISFNEKGENLKKEMLTIQFKPKDSTSYETIVWPPSIAMKERLNWPFPGWGAK